MRMRAPPRRTMNSKTHPEEPLVLALRFDSTSPVSSSGAHPSDSERLALRERVFEASIIVARRLSRLRVDRPHEKCGVASTFLAINDPARHSEVADETLRAVEALLTAGAALHVAWKLFPQCGDTAFAHRMIDRGAHEAGPLFILHKGLRDDGWREAMTTPETY